MDRIKKNKNINERMNNKTSEYIINQRKNYALHTINARALPLISDGLKPSGRRCLWIAKDGKKHKTATLGGAAMSLHPHAAPTGAIESLTGPYLNNIPLFDGEGAFGTLLNPRNAMAAPRYTAVKISDFCYDCVFCDIEIIPMQPNYDDTLQEPIHFLPLIPLVLLNPQEGIAVGFASNILPRSLEDIIISQMCYLKGQDVKDVAPCFLPTKQRAFKQNNKWVFRGEFKKINATTLKILNIPYGISHDKYITFLHSLLESDEIQDFVDHSKDQYNIELKFKKGMLRTLTENDIIKLLKLERVTSENLNVINFEGVSVWNTSYSEIISEFTQWRLNFYKLRYERLLKLLNIDIQKYKDVLTAIKYKLGTIATKCKNKKELKEFCSTVQIVHIDYISELPVYRFTEEEKTKIVKKLKEAEKLQAQYQKFIQSTTERKKIYIRELENVLKKYCN